MSAKYSTADACRWVKAGQAPSIPSTSRVTPMWRALNAAKAEGLIARDGFYWTLTDSGRSLIALGAHCLNGLQCLKDYGSCVCLCGGCKS